MHKRRLHLLIRHFELAQQLLQQDVLARLWRGMPVMLGEVAGKRETYAAELCLSDRCGARHEGGFSLRLKRSSDDFELCVVSFIIYGVPRGSRAGGFGGGYTVAIGGLQGPFDVKAKRVLIEATRDLHGLRPKDAVLLIIEGLVATDKNAGFCKTVPQPWLLAVCNAAHVINFRSSKRRAKMQSNMDQYWLDRGGVRGGEFGFLLPLRNTHLVNPASMQQVQCAVLPLSKREQNKAAFLMLGQQLLAANRDDERGEVSGIAPDLENVRSGQTG